MTTPSGERLHQLVEGTFVGPLAPRQDQPAVAVIPIDWNAYDVPRLWDMVRREADELAWIQARGFENLAQLLLSQHDTLARLRDALAESWDPQINRSAVNFFLFLDHLISAIAEDAVAHAYTSRGLHGILAALAAAKDQIGQLKQQWDGVTTDWVPEWWDHEADNLNKRARHLVAAADKTAGDHRQQITVPQLYQYPASVSHIELVESHDSAGEQPDGDRTDGGSPTGASVPAEVVPPPPVPGLRPVLEPSPQLQGLPGAPQMVPAVPGSPISMLPVPPGNPYAPSGGAYVLPGPGVGRGGWIYPMPTPPAAAGPASTPGARGGGAAGDAGQAGPPATPTATGSDQRRPYRPGRGHGELIWEVAKGVPPIIGGDVPAADMGSEQRRREAYDEAFVQWFADLATPWADDLTVDVRRAPEPGR